MAASIMAKIQYRSFGLDAGPRAEDRRAAGRRDRREVADLAMVAARV
jgi:hypothetical protein